MQYRANSTRLFTKLKGVAQDMTAIVSCLTPLLGGCNTCKKTKNLNQVLFRLSGVQTLVNQHF
ncbi:hypothetical protein KSI01_27560 [Kurthia sibirica]|nr:hypothetical protein KSI01_27560 [Kurthia sibirica]